MAKLTQKELAKLRADYLQKREEILQGKVSSLSVKLFDRIFEKYLTALELSDGKIVSNDRNINMIKGLDAIYKVFRDNDNIPVIKSFVSDLQYIVPLNERYFKNIAQKDINTTTKRAKLITNKRLGVLDDGTPIEGGFVDKFIKDQSLLKKIKKQTNQALTKGKSFQDFRQELKKTIEGVPEDKLSGGLQQYYRNFAYDTFQKVDRLNQDVFAKELGLRYFYWQGGLIKTSRPLCRECNGKIIDSLLLKNLTYDDLKEEMRQGVPDPWDPVSDLGGFACRHSKDYISDTIAQKYSNKMLDISDITE